MLLFFFFFFFWGGGGGGAVLEEDSASLGVRLGSEVGALVLKTPAESPSPLLLSSAMVFLHTYSVQAQFFHHYIIKTLKTKPCEYTLSSF